MELTTKQIVLLQQALAVAVQEYEEQRNVALRQIASLRRYVGADSLLVKPHEQAASNYDVCINDFKNLAVELEIGHRQELKKLFNENVSCA
jgi:hypothetical protein